MSCHIQDKIFLKLKYGKQLLYLYLKSTDSKFYTSSRSFPLWSLNISKLCSSVIDLCSQDFILSALPEVQEQYHVHRVCSLLSYNLFLSLVKWYYAQVNSLYRAAGAFHSKPKPAKPKDGKSVKSQQNRIEFDYSEIDKKLSNFEEIFRKMINLNQDERLITLSEPSTVLDLSQDFEYSFESETAGCILEDVFNRNENFFPLEELGAPIFVSDEQLQAAGPSFKVPFTVPQEGESSFAEEIFRLPPERVSTEAAQETFDDNQNGKKLEKDFSMVITPSPDRLGKDKFPFVPEHESTKVFASPIVLEPEIQDTSEVHLQEPEHGRTKVFASPAVVEPETQAASEVHPQEPVKQRKINKNFLIPKRALKKLKDKFPNKFKNVPRPANVLRDFLQSRKLSESSDAANQYQNIEKFTAEKNQSFNVCSPECHFVVPDFDWYDQHDSALDSSKLSANQSSSLSKYVETLLLESRKKAKSKTSDVKRDSVIDEKEESLNASPMQHAPIPVSVAEEKKRSVDPSRYVPHESLGSTLSKDKPVDSTHREMVDPIPVFHIEPTELILEEIQPIITAPLEISHPRLSEVTSEAEKQQRLEDRSDVLVYVTKQRTVDQNYVEHKLDFSSVRESEESLLMKLTDFDYLPDEGIPFETICKPVSENVEKPVLGFPKSDDICLRSSAARCFQILIGLNVKKQVRLEQRTPGKISIFLSKEQVFSRSS